MSEFEQPSVGIDHRFDNIGDLIEKYRQIRYSDPSNLRPSPTEVNTNKIEFPLDDKQMEILRLRDTLQELGVHFNIDGEIDIANCSQAVQDAIRRQNEDHK